MPRFAVKQAIVAITKFIIIRNERRETNVTESSWRVSLILPLLVIELQFVVRAG